MVSVLLEKEYANSIWCKNLYLSLTQSLRQKRIPFCEIFDQYPADSEGVFIIASDYEWVKSVIKQFNNAGIQPILICNQLERIPGCLYSCVCSDVNASMQNLLAKLRSLGKTKVALYGVNTNSIADIGRVESVFSWKDSSYSVQVFTNDGSLSDCFDAFYPLADKFDTVICTNDFAAVSLVKRLEERDKPLLDRLTVISCAKTELSSGYSHITSIDLNFAKYGQEAVRIFERLQKHPYLSSVTSGIIWDLGQEERPVKGKGVSLTLPQTEDTFYNDKELKDMLVVDKFINTADQTDRVIMNCLIDGQPYEKIADKCFLTESGIKYRVKKILQNCGAENRESLQQLIAEYIKTLD